MKSCFVIQGYGRKTDYRDGRVLDLDASYAIIKDAVEAAGLDCVRADEIQHSGTIDLPMYEWLLNADLVVADLSTYNVNAVFELGVRYALRPHATIIVAEELFQNPFDFSHLAIRRYKHLGEDIGAKEARRFRDELKAAILAIAAERRTDSPIYTFLPNLRPPLDQKALDEQALAPFAPRPAAAHDIPEHQPPTANLLVKDGGADAEAVDLNTKQLQEQAQKRINDSDFASARVLLEEARKRRPTDSFVIQRLALSIYKSKQPDPVTALTDALEVLRVLKPETCNNPETLGLYGAIHKRLWEINPAPKLLDIGITAYARAFALKQDHYTGINFAFLLDQRAREHLKAGRRDDAITDHTLAIRMRKDVAQIARAHLERLPEEIGNEHFWVLASLWEAALGSGDTVALAGYEAALRSMKVADWMQDTWQWQGKKLRALIEEYAALSQQA
jgi:tetratricopeptide (TPR) repeat protein